MIWRARHPLFIRRYPHRSVLQRSDLHPLCALASWTGSRGTSNASHHTQPYDVSVFGAVNCSNATIALTRLALPPRQVSSLRSKRGTMDTHTHTHTRTHARTHMHTRTHAHARAHTQRLFRAPFTFEPLSTVHHIYTLTQKTMLRFVSPRQVWGVIVAVGYKPELEPLEKLIGSCLKRKCVSPAA